MLFRSATLVLLMMLSLASGAQQPLSRTTVLPASGLQEDVQILRSAFEQLHPGLYRYNSRQQMDAAFDRLAMDFGKTKRSKLPSCGSRHLPPGYAVVTPIRASSTSRTR